MYACMSTDRYHIAGSVYYYAQVEGHWSRQSKLMADDAFNDDHFGRSVTVYNCSAFVGAYFDDDKNTDSGSRCR
jgi:hypothetical protein